MIKSADNPHGLSGNIIKAISPAISASFSIDLEKCDILLFVKNVCDRRGKKPNSVGRPSAYTSGLCDKLIDVMATGLSLDAAAVEIGISPRTAYQWQRDIAEFSQAVEIGRAKALLVWEKRAIAVANGKPGNAAIISLGLRNRSRSASGWHEAIRNEHSSPDGQPMQIEQVTKLDTRTLTSEQRGALKAALLAVTAEVKITD